MIRFLLVAAIIFPSCSSLMKINERGYYHEGVSIIATAVPRDVLLKCGVSLDADLPTFVGVSRREMDGRWGRFERGKSIIKYEKDSPEIIIHETVHYLLENTDDYCAKEIAANLAQEINTERKRTRYARNRQFSR